MDDFIDFELAFEQELQAEHALHAPVRSEDDCPLCDEEANLEVTESEARLLDGNR